MIIHSFRVRNFRSLKDVTIGDLSPVVIFYGHNDTGKSNLLSFLETLFSEKYEEEVTQVGGEGAVVQKRASPFWRGKIDNFSDDFFWNSSEPVQFEVNVRMPAARLRVAEEFPAPFLASIRADAVWLHLVLEGRIESDVGDTASIVLARAKLGGKILFDGSRRGPEQFLPGYKGVSPAEATGIFESIMGMLNGSFMKIPASRALEEEDETPREQSVVLSPSTFKNWLFRAQTSRERESLFRRISDRFVSAPFAMGRVSIGRILDRGIEILVEDKNGLKLPIGRKGGGIQQILVILGYVQSGGGTFLGVEELEVGLSPKTQTSLFDDLFQLAQLADGPIGQVFLTTHSPHIAKRNEATRRAVSIHNGETKVEKPRAAQITDFFRFP